MFNIINMLYFIALCMIEYIFATIFSPARTIPAFIAVYAGIKFNGNNGKLNLDF